MAKFNAQSTTYTYVFLHEGSYYSLREAVALEEGSFFRFMSSMLFSSFSLEGYLYFLGERYIPSWSRKEQRMGQVGRLQAVLHALGMTPDMSERPFKTHKEMFEFRNALVHSRVIRSTTTGSLASISQRPPKPLSEWEKLINQETAQRFFDDSSEIIRIMHKKAGFVEDPFATPWVSQWEVRPE